MHAGVQGRAESKCDRNLVTSNSDIISVEAPAKRKADAEFTDDQLPVKKMKSGKHCYCVTYADRLRVNITHVLHSIFLYFCCQRQTDATENHTSTFCGDEGLTR